MALVQVLAWLQLAPVARAVGPCDPPVNPIVCENSKPGSPASQWDVVGSGSASIQGFATDISVDQGQTVAFKIKTPATSYRLDIYRLGYYGGLGGRQIASVQPSASLPQAQPACVKKTATGLTDCGNWGVSATWGVPADAVSGVYVAKLIRTDGTSGASHVVFVVRDDNGNSDLLFQTSDTTWQAYNRYGGKSLYNPSTSRAKKVSYNRPFTTRAYAAHDWVFNAEYPMIRWLEANGYHVSYFTDVDSARRGTEILEHDVFLSVGHDEYWSGDQRANVEAARDAGVNLAFFSGNEVFWKTRWENSVAGASTPFRTLVSYKETRDNAKTDPNPAWTGTWRDPRFSPPSDGGRPENALTGTIFTVNGPRNDAIKVPSSFRNLRIWRNTPVAQLSSGQVYTMPAGTLGYEWDEDLDNGFRPAGLFPVSSTTVNGVGLLQDYGASYATGAATHSLTMYRAASGALVFGAGTIQWAWGLDSSHDGGSAPTDLAMRQATVNLFADMGVQPASLQPGLISSGPSTDTAAPATQIDAPGPGSFTTGDHVTISGTATDADGVVAAVEVSTDGGATWHPATGRGSWTYTWVPDEPGDWQLLSRGVDDTGNLGSPSPGPIVTVAGRECPCSLWSNGTIPSTTSSSDTQAVEVGLRFRSRIDGFVTGVRFYKGSNNTGTHVGHLWTQSGTQLAAVTFSGESANGWQQANFASPVPVTAGTTYVVSYHAPNGHYAIDQWAFATSGLGAWPLSALADWVDGRNGVFKYGASAFPTSNSKSSNYWVDVVFDTQTGGSDTQPPSVTETSPAGGATGVPSTSTVTATFDEPVDPASIVFTVTPQGGAQLAGSLSYDNPSRTATFTPAQALAPATSFTASVSATDLAGNAMLGPTTWSFTTDTDACPCSLFGTSTPTVTATSDPNAVELGVKFRSSTNGSIAGIRFYKGTTNTGTHVGSLWTTSGSLLSQATFAGETASGWQEVMFTSPVPITAGTTYVASYHTTVGHYAEDVGYFTSAVTNGSLTAIKSSTANGANGVFVYTASPAFPTNGNIAKARNYWVDVLFTTA